MSTSKLATAFGPFDLLEMVGKGGMAKVYRGRHRESGAVVAVKVALKVHQGNEVLLARFEHEYKVGKRLQHPHLARALDFGEAEGMPYLVMEFVDGPSLDKYINHMGRLDEEEILSIGLQIAYALHFLHSQKLIHRDVKPGNILLGPGGVAKLADLGLIKSKEENLQLTQSHAKLGTLIFAPPEQLDNARNVDARSDIYALAGTMYLAVTGEYPFGKRGQLGIMKRKMENDFVAACGHFPELSTQLDLALRKALRAEPNLRPANCRDFGKLLTGRDDFQWTEETLPEAPPAGSNAPPVPAPEMKSVSGNFRAIKEEGKENSKVFPKPIAPDERRAVVRYSVNLESTCRPMLDHKSGWWKAYVRDVSSGGVCLRVNRRFETGVLLEVHVVAAAHLPRFSPILRVRWVKQEAEGEWLLGCAFTTPLEQCDLEDVLFDDGMQTDNE